MKIWMSELDTSWQSKEKPHKMHKTDKDVKLNATEIE